VEDSKSDKTKSSNKKKDTEQDKTEFISKGYRAPSKIRPPNG